MRSRRRCSMCPAIHINSRSWLRSSSTREPSDPPLRVFFQVFFYLSAKTRWGGGRGDSSPRRATSPRLFPCEEGKRPKQLGHREFEKRGENGGTTDSARCGVEGGGLPLRGPRAPRAFDSARAGMRPCLFFALMILPQVHLRKPCYDFYFL